MCKFLNSCNQSNINYKNVLKQSSNKCSSYCAKILIVIKSSPYITTPLCFSVLQLTLKCAHGHQLQCLLTSKLSIMNSEMVFLSRRYGFSPPHQNNCTQFSNLTGDFRWVKIMISPVQIPATHSFLHSRNSAQLFISVHGSVVTCNHKQDYIVLSICIFIKITPIWENVQDIL